MVGFEFHSYGEGLVHQILVNYLAGSSLEKISIDLEGVTAAQAQRIVNEAIKRGTLLPEDKHPIGCSKTKILKAAEVLERHPNARPIEVARMVGCAESTVWRAKARMCE